MLNYSNIIYAMKEVIMSEKLTEKQQDRMVNSMCIIGLLIGFGVAATPIVWLIKVLV